MKIYAMTATFGKLEHDTLTLKPGLNVIHAPNEWGKSTWCAFLVAMLYGIETRVHTTKSVIADKERYAPWSGSPMAGRIDLNWNGRDITIERSSKGRSVFGVFKAYETQTGMAVPELTAANCGQQLLGVEKSVFIRSGFLRLADLPVTQDEALRARLNALVTTGDESGAAEDLAQTLKDLKNRCRLNRSTGLLPQAEAQRAELESKLRELEQLQTQCGQVQQRQQQLEQYRQQLENHRDALAYEANRAYAQKLQAAEAAQAAAQAKADALEADCNRLPQADAVDQALLQMYQLQERRSSLHMEAQMLPPLPDVPEGPAAYQGQTPADARRLAETDQRVYAQAVAEAASRLWLILGILTVIAGIAAVLIPHWVRFVLSPLAVAAGLVMIRSHFAGKKRALATMEAIVRRNQPQDPQKWADTAEAYARQQQAYAQRMDKLRDDRQDLTQRTQALEDEIRALTHGKPLEQCRQAYAAAQEQWKALSEARRELQRTADTLQTLRLAHKEAAPPKFPDSMTHTEQQTARLLSDVGFEQRQLHERLGHCQGRMAALGQEANLQKELEGVNLRITQLNDTYAALEIAQSTLAQATAQLQRRFAPRIAQRAQELFGKLTDGRYTRLTLADDFSVHAGAQDEPTLHGALWRSDGTIDQLYLALRLAVAEELTPQAPLILDDALVRFDDKRLREAMDVLAEAADSKQVILFTCQSREQALLPPEK